MIYFIIFNIIYKRLKYTYKKANGVIWIQILQTTQTLVSLESQ